MRYRSSIRYILLSMLTWMAASMEVCAQNPLKGTPIGSTSIDYSTGNPSTTVNTPDKAFDNNMLTFYASYDRSRTWVGLDLGTPHVITRVGWVARNDGNGPKRMQLGLFEGANDPDFLDAVPLYLIPGEGKVRTWMYANVKVTRAFRYVRYVGPADARCNVADLRFYGTEGEGSDAQFYQVTNLPTLSIHVYSGNDPQDKVNDLEANMTLVYDGGTRIQEYPITTRLRGNASMGFEKKPYRIKFNDGKSHHIMKGSPLESPAKAKKWTLINNHGDKTLMRNIVAFELSRRLGMPYTPYCQPVDIIMNGEYKGCYQLCDQITTDPHRVNIVELGPLDTEEPIITGGYLLEVDAYAYQEQSWFSSSRGLPVTIKSPDEDDINAQQKRYIQNYFNALERKVWSTSYTDTLKGFRTHLDTESFLKHFFVGEFSGNTDTYWSTYMSKDREKDQFIIGPVWDFDLAFDNDNRTYPVNNHNNWIYRDGGSSAEGMSGFVTRILSDPGIQHRMKTMWSEMRMSGKFTEASLIRYVDSISTVLDASQKLNFIRWPIMNQYVHNNPVIHGSYEAEVKTVSDFLKGRITWIDNFLGIPGGIIKEDSTYYISQPQQLIDFAKDVNDGATGSTAILTADLDMSATDGTFTPIGTENRPFHGRFDGRGHRIKGLKVKSSSSHVGLFGVIEGGAVVKGFVLDGNSSISGISYVGIVGSATGTGTVTLEQIGNEAAITGSGRNVSAFVGCNLGSELNLIINDCYNAGTIVGGIESAALVGWTGDRATITNTYNIGTVSGTDGMDHYLTRGGTTFDNTYSTRGVQATQTDQSEVKSGALCYLLNEGNTFIPVWRQNLTEDPYPIFDTSHSVVYLKDGVYVNGGAMRMGDVNDDGNVDRADLEDIHSYILGFTPELFFAEAADINQDQSIDVHDLVLLANIIRGTESTGTTFSAKCHITAFRITPGNTKEVNVIVTTDVPAAGLQIDFKASEGLTILPESFTLTDQTGVDHVIRGGQTEEGVRVVAYSPTNESFKRTTGALLTFKVTAATDFTSGTLQGQSIATTATGAKAAATDFTCNVKAASGTDIEGIEDDSEKVDEIYTLSGVRLDKITREGIYIINGEKKYIHK